MTTLQTFGIWQEGTRRSTSIWFLKQRKCSGACAIKEFRSRDTTLLLPFADRCMSRVSIAVGDKVDCSIPPLLRTVRRPGLVLLAAAVILLRPASHADTDPVDEPADPPSPRLSTETAAIDSGAVETAAAEVDTARPALAWGSRLPFPGRGLRLDGSWGILRDSDRRLPMQALLLRPLQREALRRWRQTQFTQLPVAPPKAEPEREVRE